MKGFKSYLTQQAKSTEEVKRVILNVPRIIISEGRKKAVLPPELRHCRQLRVDNYHIFMNVVAPDWCFMYSQCNRTDPYNPLQYYFNRQQWNLMYAYSKTFDSVIARSEPNQVFGLDQMGDINLP